MKLVDCRLHIQWPVGGALVGACGKSVLIMMLDEKRLYNSVNVGGWQHILQRHFDPKY